MLGAYNPLLWQEPKDNQWVRANAFVKAEVREGVPLIVDVTCDYRGGEAITAVGEDGTMPDPTGEPVKFQVTHRFVVWPNCPYIAVRMVRVRNLEAKRSLRMHSYFFYLPSAIGGDAANDEPKSGLADVPNYYRRSAGTAWHDAEVNARYGLVPMDERLIAMFWVDKGGGQHPDTRVVFKPALEIAPGQEYVAPEDAPIGLLYGVRDDDWPVLERQLDAATGIKLMTP
jgi:hypothetical protein